jgi:O-antigen/teichoic acid export membrane protein
VKGGWKSLLTSVSGGIVDAGFASLATFAMGLTATRVFSASELGVYAIFFTAFLTAAVIPTHLVYTPAEVVCVAHPIGQRTRVLRRSLRSGHGVAALSASMVLLATAAAWPIATPRTVLALTVTCMVAGFLSPIQDHVRRVQIKDGAAWLAAIVSFVQFTAIAVALGVLWLSPLDVAWLPFGSLAAANAVSLTAGLAFSRFHRLRPLPEPMSFRTLVPSGRWLTVSQVLPTGATFLAATIISRLAGTAELGYAEAARIAAQPLLVIGFGIAAVFQPRFMVAASQRDLREARITRRLFHGTMALCTIGYLVVGGWSWSLNPMAYLMPQAYAIPGLVALYVVANLANTATYSGWSELAGGGHEVPLAGINSLASIGLLVAAVTARVTGAFAQPLGVLLQGLARLGLYWPAQRAMYRADERVKDPPETITTP